MGYFNKSTERQLRNIQLFWGLFIGIGAFAGSFGLISDPSGTALGMQDYISFFQKLPLAEILFQDFLFPGIALLVLIGLSNAISVILIFRKNKLAAVSGILCGIVLILWIFDQFYIFPLNFMSSLYFVFGILQAVNGWMYFKKTKELNKYS